MLDDNRGNRPAQPLSTAAEREAQLDREIAEFINGGESCGQVIDLSNEVPVARTHRDQIEAALRQYAGARRLPGWLRNPQTSQQFDLAMAVALDGKPGVSPVYDADGFLAGWRGIGLRSSGGPR